jgi:hypothetical protein
MKLRTETPPDSAPRPDKPEERAEQRTHAKDSRIQADRKGKLPHDHSGAKRESTSQGSE